MFITKKKHSRIVEELKVLNKKNLELAIKDEKANTEYYKEKVKELQDEDSLFKKNEKEIHRITNQCNASIDKLKNENIANIANAVAQAIKDTVKLCHEK